MTQTRDGRTRRAGYELEFSGIDLATASRTVATALGGRLETPTSAEHRVHVDGLGDFGIEIDWDFLKRNARESAEIAHKEWVAPLSEAAPLVVPIEVVAPPIALDRLQLLDEMVDALRAAGAQGTDESLIAAYGVHINPEIPDTAPAVIHRYLRAFALLQWWLMEAHDLDPMRRLTPYINPWPEAYLREVLSLHAPSLAELIDTYLAHNPTRNRALDMLPLFAHLDPERVAGTVDDARIKARPTFHYRLPNCRIEQANWSLARSWRLWCTVEALAWDEAALDGLGRAFLDAQRPLLGVDRADWRETARRWLAGHGLA